MNQTNSFGMQYGGGDGERPATAAQLATYTKMCRQKGKTPQNVHGATYATLSALIQETIEMPKAASESQYKLIMELTEQMGLNIGQDVLAKLNIASAGDLITQLRDKQRDMRETLPASESQVKMMMDMYLCPDVNYEYLDIPNKIELGYDMERTDGSKVSAWRLLTPDELNAYLIRVRQQHASDFIGQFRDVFREWRRTRLSETQMQSIRNLERAASNMNGAGRPVTEATMIEGTNIVIGIVQNADRTRRDKTIGYVPLEEHALQQFTYEQANQYINMMRDEIFNADKYKSPSDELNPSTDMRDQHTLRNVKSLAWNEMNNALHKLLAVAGIEDDQLLESCLDLCDTGYSDDKISESRSYIQTFMQSLIKEGYITTTAMLIMIEPSQELTDILVGV